MKIRPAASSALLSEMMARVVEVHNFSELLTYLQVHYDFWGPTKDNVTIEEYGPGIDERISWDTHLICVGGHAALFSDGPMEKDNESQRAAGGDRK